MTRRRGSAYTPKESVLSGLKDYIVPIVGIVLVLLLMYIFFGRGEKAPDPSTLENRDGVDIVFADSAAVEVEFVSGKQEAITPETDLYKGEKLVVKDGRAEIKEASYVFNIDKRGELAYGTDGTFAIENGDVWLDTQVPMQIDMRFGTVSVGENSHLSFTQNEVGSTVYLVAGSAEVKNNAGKSTVLAPQEKIEIAVKDAKDEELDLALKKEPLGDYFTNSEWYLLNNGASYIVTETDEENEEETPEKEDEQISATIDVSESVATNEFLTFGNLSDGQTVTTSTINVYGNYSREDISKVIINGKDANLNTENKSFNIEGVEVNEKTNDLVIKVLSGDKEVSKFVYTVFNSNPAPAVATPAPEQTAPAEAVETPAEKTPEVTTFTADPSQYTITAPTTNGEYTTIEDFVTIRGVVTAEGIDKVIVNGHELNSYKGSTWRYHASVAYGNLGAGTNLYTISYYTGDQLVYKNYYTIIKSAE